MNQPPFDCIRRNITARSRVTAGIAVLLSLAFLVSTVCASPQGKTKKGTKKEPKAGTKFETAEEAFRAGVAYLSLNEDAKSQEPLEQALKLAPDDKFKLKVYEALIPAYTLLPDIDKKVEALEFMIDKSDSAAARSLARRSLLAFVHQRGKVEVVVQRYEDVLKKDPNNKTALYILSELYGQLRENPRRSAELTEKLAAVMKKEGGQLDVGAQAGLAGQYVKAGKFKEGAELYEKIADLDAMLAAWHWKEAAQAWLKAKDKAKALAAAKASDASPGENRNDLLEHFWHKALADVFLELGESRLAIPHYEKAIEKTNIAGYIEDSKKKLAEARAKAGPNTAPAAPSKTSQIDLNRATLDELKSVEGITESLAVQIIDRRKKKPFKSVSELIELDAVDKSLLEKLRPRIKVEGEK